MFQNIPFVSEIEWYVRDSIERMERRVTRKIVFGISFALAVIVGVMLIIASAVVFISRFFPLDVAFVALGLIFLFCALIIRLMR